MRGGGSSLAEPKRPSAADLATAQARLIKVSVREVAEARPEGAEAFDMGIIDAETLLHWATDDVLVPWPKFDRKFLRCDLPRPRLHAPPAAQAGRAERGSATAH